jgi:hypothetical protein
MPSRTSVRWIDNSSGMNDELCMLFVDALFVILALFVDFIG